MTTTVFIGTFDPFHGGHIGQLLRAHHVISFSKILILINKNPSHKPNASSWQHRLNMAKLTLDAVDLPFQYEVLPVENPLANEITQPVNYKITGIDSLVENISDPSRWEFITKWPLIVLSIPNIEEALLTKAVQTAPDDLREKLHYVYVSEKDAPMMNYDFQTKTFSSKRVHSTYLRSGESDGFIPQSVKEYLHEHHLYKS